MSMLSGMMLEAASFAQSETLELQLRTCGVFEEARSKGQKMPLTKIKDGKSFCGQFNVGVNEESGAQMRAEGIQQYRVYSIAIP